LGWAGGGGVAAAVSKQCKAKPKAKLRSLLATRGVPPPPCGHASVYVCSVQIPLHCHFGSSPGLSEKWKMASAIKFVFPPSPPYKLGSPQLGSWSRFRFRLWGGASAQIFISLCGFSFRFARFVSTSRVPGVTYTLRGQGPGYAPCLVRFETRTHLPSGGCVVCHRADTVAIGYLPYK